MTDRWPAWIYDQGEEPDYRFSFANERTFLAWIRTALSLLAVGVAIDVLGISGRLQRGLALILVVLGVASAIAAWVRWGLAERAMRRGGPLPSFGFGVVFTVTVAITAVVLVATGL